MYTAKEPSENQKIEFMMAQMMALYINGNSRKGAAPKKPDDFILKSFWKTDVEQDVDVIKKAFGLKK